jgi:pimeloyl-ACP methyl ester carboxylesterase
MTTTDQVAPTRVTSPDGTAIGWWTTGEGPPLVLVHGGTADHSRWRPLLPFLEPHVTVHAVDRRGRGASTDGPDYDIEREFEDVAAVVDAIAASTGAPVDLLGHSFGGVCALGAATRTANVRRLVLYEPPVNPDPAAFPDGLLERLEGLLADDRRQEVLETFFREAVMMPEHELAVFRTLPAWQARVAAAHTITRELRAVLSGRAFDAARAATITAPTLMLLGGDSPEVVREETATVVAALPDARVVVLDGEQHIAIDRIPEAFAGHVLAFLREVA